MGAASKCKNSRKVGRPSRPQIDLKAALSPVPQPGAKAARHPLYLAVIERLYWWNIIREGKNEDDYPCLCYRPVIHQYGG